MSKKVKAASDTTVVSATIVVSYLTMQYDIPPEVSAAITGLALALLSWARRILEGKLWQ